MTLCLLTGGARSGKSSCAVTMAGRGARPVVFVATGSAGDEEMADRIARHRAQRPPSWITIEEPLLVAAVLADCPSKSIVVIDCLTLWVSNLLAHGNDECAIVNAAKQLAATAHTREAPVIVVTNEVGSGIVPIRPLARTYRDILGRVNATLGAAADTAYLAVAGRLLPLSSAAEIALE